MVINVFGVRSIRKEKTARKTSYVKQPYTVTVNGRVVYATRTLKEAERIAKSQRRHAKKRGAVKIVKR